MNATNEALVGGEGVDQVIHEAAGSGSLDEFGKLNCCETDEFKITLGYKLFASYVFYTVGPKDNIDYKLKNCYESCLEKVLG